MIRRAWQFLFLLLCALTGARAQSIEAAARATSVTGAAAMTSSGTTFALTPGTILNPGDRVDTRAGGRVVIELTDGSMVVVNPGSFIEIKDYRAATSLRELFDIMIGQVRVKVNHFYGRQNPYRMNTPTASIAVRGTEFTIVVDAQGDTRVTVYEGAVEVTSLTDPAKSYLIEAGRGVLVQPNQDFLFFAAPAAREVADRGDDSDSDRHSNSAGPDSREDHDSKSPLAVDGAYQRYIASLSQIGELPFQSRYLAFSDPYLDSLENPANLTIFHQPEGLLSMSPTISGSPAQLMDYSLSPTVSMFLPVTETVVIGGSAGVARTEATGSLLTADSGSGHGGNNLPIVTSGAALSDFSSASFFVGWRLLDHDSLGFAIEHLGGNGSISNASVDNDGPGHIKTQTVATESTVEQTRLTAGYSWDISRNHKLDFFYRYGLVNGADADASRFTNVTALPLNSTLSWGHSSELGFRVRGAITPRLSYGVLASWLGLSLTDSFTLSSTVDSRQGDISSRGSLGVGLGYLLNHRTLLSFDAAAGDSRVHSTRFGIADPILLQRTFADSYFMSLHGAVQYQISHRLSLSGTLMYVAKRYETDQWNYPDPSGNVVSVLNPLFPADTINPLPATWYSDLGVGWRFSPRLFAQYLFSTDYGITSSTHTLILRYTLGPRSE